MVQGLSVLKAPSKVCKGCLIGKQQRDTFPKESTWRASQILQLIHADICGPITPSPIATRGILSVLSMISVEKLGVSS